MTLIICAQSGTVLYAGQCYILADDAVSEDELESSSDSEIAALAVARGRKVSDEIQALDDVAAALSINYYEPSDITVTEVTGVLTRAGRIITSDHPL